MAQKAPSKGRIVIDWQRLPAEHAEDGVAAFDWQISMEPSSLDDDEVERLLRQITDRL